ncbi:MAG: hypothetical protein M1835_005798 [Candelina submexicana]|nr:MAG: hypothetical protein M1835_005798 [Candelina submexicana]
MDLCPQIANTTIANTTIQWGQLQADSVQTLAGNSYLRPDKGGALLPWVYTLLVLVAHLPTVILRVVKWEAAQTWCLATTTLTVVVYCLAYVSTQLAADKILVWTPLLLVIDAGAMAQILFLICEDKRVLVRIQKMIRSSLWYANASKLCAQLRVRLPGSRPERPAFEPIPSRPRALEDNAQGLPVPHPAMLQDYSIYVAVISFLLLLAIIILQILGLVGAVRANPGNLPLPAPWCSPIFQPFGIAVRDGNCRVYNVEMSSAKGVGCILIDGTIQRGWLKGTVWGTSVALILEFFDLCILTFVNSNARPRGVQMNRPWFTMFSGLAVLLVTLIFGIIYSSELPPGITEKVWVVVNLDKPTLWAGTLKSAGLRGAVIGWNDGLFEAWNDVYFGAWVSVGPQ